MIRQILKYGLLVAILVVVSSCGPKPTATPTTVPPPAEPTATERPEPTTVPTEAAVTVWSKPVVFGTHGEPNTIDPATVSNSSSEGWVINAAYEALTRYRRDGEILPWLAESWEISDDAKTYTFHLRDGVKFHDGTDLDAEAVKLSFERTKDMQLGVAFILDPVGEIRVVDELTVEITLSEQDIAFWFGLPHIKVISPTALEANRKDGDWAQDFFLENAVGTGPYRVGRWDRGSQLELVAFEDYWGGWDGKHIQRFIIRYGIDYSTRLLMLEQGEIHMVDYAGLSDVRRAATNPDVVLHTGSPIWGFYQFMRQEGPLADLKVRQAMLHAFPYDAMLEVMQHFAEPMKSPLSPDMLGYCEVFEPKQDLEKARELLAEAGYPDGGFELKQAYRFANEPRRQAAQLYQEALAELGIEVILEDIEWGVFVQAQKQKDTAYDMSSLWVLTPVPYGGAQLFLIGHSSQQGIGRNWAFYDNPEFDALLDEAQRLSPEDPKVNELLCEAQRILIEDVVVIPIMASQRMDLTRTELKGLEYDPYGYPGDLHIYEMFLED